MASMTKTLISLARNGRYTTLTTPGIFTRISGAIRFYRRLASSRFCLISIAALCGLMLAACNPQPISGRLDVVVRDGDGRLIETRRYKGELLIVPFPVGVRQGDSNQAMYQEAIYQEFLWQH